MPSHDPATDPIALIDLDGTLADYDGSMRRALMRLCSPAEQTTAAESDDLHALSRSAPHWQARMDLIMRRPGWWRELARIEQNFEIVELMRSLDFDLHVLTKGPWSKSQAWAEKVDWCQRHIPDAEVHITGSRTGKGMVYGKVLFDDHPPYVESWLKWRPRGLVIMPHHPHNAHWTHANAVRWDGGDAARRQIEERLAEVRAASR